MEFIIIIGMIPGFIVFDIIPKMFGYKGLMDWYINKYKKEADSLLMIYLLFFIIIASIIFFQTN
jgi:hypothetical protein